MGLSELVALDTLYTSVRADGKSHWNTENFICVFVLELQLIHLGWEEFVSAGEDLKTQCVTKPNCLKLIRFFLQNMNIPITYIRVLMCKTTGSSLVLLSHLFSIPDLLGDSLFHPDITAGKTARQVWRHTGCQIRICIQIFWFEVAAKVFEYCYRILLLQIWWYSSSV